MCRIFLFVIAFSRYSFRSDATVQTEPGCSRFMITVKSPRSKPRVLLFQHLFFGYCFRHFSWPLEDSVVRHPANLSQCRQRVMTLQVLLLVVELLDILNFCLFFNPWAQRRDVHVCSQQRHFETKSSCYACTAFPRKVSSSNSMVIKHSLLNSI